MRSSNTMRCHPGGYRPTHTRDHRELGTCALHSLRKSGTGNENDREHQQRSACRSSSANPRSPPVVVSIASSATPRPGPRRNAPRTPTDPDRPRLRSIARDSDRGTPDEHIGLEQLAQRTRDVFERSDVCGDAKQTTRSGRSPSNRSMISRPPRRRLDGSGCSDTRPRSDSPDPYLRGFGAVSAGEWYPKRVTPGDTPDGSCRGKRRERHRRGDCSRSSTSLPRHDAAHDASPHDPSGCRPASPASDTTQLRGNCAEAAKVWIW